MQTIKNRSTAKVQIPLFYDVPGIDLYTEGDNLITDVLLPDFKPDEVKVTAISRSMIISAVRKPTPKDKSDPVDENRWSFWRCVVLPLGAKPEKLKYSLRDGKLRIMIPMDWSGMNAWPKANARKEAGHAIYQTTSPSRHASAVVWSDQGFPNHWTRYRPVR